jgi:hypothetical protein
MRELSETSIAEIAFGHLHLPPDNGRCSMRDDEHAADLSAIMPV